MKLVKFSIVALLSCLIAFTIGLSITVNVSADEKIRNSISELTSATVTTKSTRLGILSGVFVDSLEITNPGKNNDKNFLSASRINLSPPQNLLWLSPVKSDELKISDVSIRLHRKGRKNANYHSILTFMRVFENNESPPEEKIFFISGIRIEDLKVAVLDETDPSNIEKHIVEIDEILMQDQINQEIRQPGLTLKELANLVIKSILYEVAYKSQQTPARVGRDLRLMLAEMESLPGDKPDLRSRAARQTRQWWDQAIDSFNEATEEIENSGAKP